MLNVFYRDSHLGSRMSGPKKVIENLIRSLEDTNTPFVLNEEKYELLYHRHITGKEDACLPMEGPSYSTSGGTLISPTYSVP